MADGPRDGTAVQEILAKINVPENIYPQTCDEDVKDVLQILSDIAVTGFFSLDWKMYIMPFVALKINRVR
jgi:hypothetical protein